MMERVKVIGWVRNVRMASGKPGRMEVVLEAARTPGVVDELGDAGDKGLVMEVEFKSLQTEMDMGRVDRETGEVLEASAGG